MKRLTFLVVVLTIWVVGMPVMAQKMQQPSAESIRGFLPTAPFPQNGATGVPTSTWLKWTIADSNKLYEPNYYSLLYFVYFTEEGEEFPATPTYIESHQPLNDYRGTKGALWPPFARNDEIPQMKPGVTYKWKVVTVWLEDGREIRVEGPVWTFATRSNTRDLLQSYPNPFNSATTIKFSLTKTAFVILSIYNVRGQRVTVLAKGDLFAGQHTIRWRANSFPSGQYFLVLQAGDRKVVRRILLIK